MKQTETKRKPIILEVTKLITLVCRGCGETLDNPNGAPGFITQDAWASVPEQITCPACSTVLVIPKRLNPFK